MPLSSLSLEAGGRPCPMSPSCMPPGGGGPTLSVWLQVNRRGKAKEHATRVLRRVARQWRGEATGVAVCRWGEAMHAEKEAGAQVSHGGGGAGQGGVRGDVSGA